MSVQGSDGRDEAVKIVGSATVGRDVLKVTLSCPSEQGGETTAAFPAVALRDNCPCPTCKHPTTLQRTVDSLELDVERCMAPESATVEDSGDLRVVWLDGHASTFSAAWLQEHAKATVPNTTTPRGWNPAWMAAQLEAHCTFAFEDVLARGGITGDWVQALQRYGLTKLTGAPQQSGQLSRLSRVLALPLRRTVYDEGGKETFQVQVKPGANNQAYTASALPLHSDLPFYEHPPAVQMLHCIQQDAGAGGASLFADGLAAVEQYRVSSPEGFRLLSTVPVLFDDVDPRTPSR